MLFYSAMQNSSKTWQRRWQKVDKIKTTNKFKDYVRSHVDSQLFKAAPNFNQPLLQFVDSVDFPVVYTTLHYSPDLVINWIEIWTVWRPQIWGNEVWCFSTQNLHSFTRTIVLQGNVATKLSYGGMGNFSFLLWPISFWIRHWKNFKNWPAFAKVTVKIKVAQFFSDSQCITKYIMTVGG